MFVWCLRLSILVRAGRLLDRDLDLGLLNLLAIHTDTGAHDIAGDNWANTLGSASQDDVTGLERHNLGDIAKDAGNLVLLLLGPAILTLFPVEPVLRFGIVRVLNTGLLNEL
ncbi:hypothetical protein OFM35_28850, partial [Escherichia coli]|nr:hypothetical protein [Escherichia coli]